MQGSKEHMLANAPIVICLVGITGEGKSTTGNTISGEKAFQASAKTRSVTRGCAFIDFQMNNVAYRIIDTPGLQDTNLTPAELLDRFKHFADLAPQGVDAFLFVCKRGRFKSEHFHAFRTFQEACTSEALSYTAFLFTNLDEETNEEFQLALREEAPEVPNLVECLSKVNGRALGIDNKGGAARSAADRTLVINLVSQIRSINLGHRYSNEFLHEADEWRRNMEAQAIKLEISNNRETIKYELDELLHGRRSRAQVETKLIDLQNAEEEARRVKEEAEAARKAKEKAEEQIRLMQAQAEAARKAKEEAVLREEQRRIAARKKNMEILQSSNKEHLERSEVRKLLMQMLECDPDDIAKLQPVLPVGDYSLPEEYHGPGSPWTLAEKLNAYGFADVSEQHLDEKQPKQGISELFKSSLETRIERCFK